MDKSLIHILIVDDEEDLTEISADTFESEGFKVSSFFTGDDALTFFNSGEKIDVIISDSHMPGISGIELLENIVASEIKTPLFYLCTGDIEVQENDIIEKGAKGLVVKPYDLDALVERVSKDMNV